MLSKAMYMLVVLASTLFLVGCKHNRQHFDPEFALLKEVPPDVSIEYLVKHPEQYTFVTSNKVFGGGYSERASWMRLTFESTLTSEDSQWFLQFYVPVNKTVYYVNEAGGWDSLSLDRANPDSNSGSVLIRQSLLLNDLLNHQPVIYFKTLHNDPHSMGHQVLQLDEFHKNNQLEALFWGAIIGLVVFACLISFVLAIVNKNLLLGYFGLMCLMVLAWDLMLLQYAQLLRLSLYGESYLQIVDSLTVLIASSILLFVDQYIGFSEANKWFRGWLKFLPVTCVLSLILVHGPVNVPEAHDLMAIFTTLSALTVLIGICYGVVLRKRSALIIGITWLPGVGLSLLSVPMFLGLIPENWFTSNVMTLGSSIALLMFAVALFDNVYLLRKDRDGLLKDQTKRLELKVRKQTWHLEKQTKEIEQQRNILESTLSYKEELFANIAHELKTPLTLILGVLNGNYSESERKTKLRKFVYRISHLLDMMFDLSKIKKSSPSSRDMHCYRANEFLEFYMTTYIGFTSKERLIITQNESAVVCCPPDTLDKVITNLFNNAIKYSPRSSSIDIRAEVNNGYWEFVVENLGEGIKPSQLESVFERYVRVGDANQSYGLGLGLPLVKQLVEAVSGCIEIVSGPNEKTCVIVKIPLATKEQLAECELKGVNVDDLTDDYRHWLYAELEQPIQSWTKAQPLQDSSSPKSLVYCIDDNIELLNQLKDQLSERYQLDCFDNPVVAFKQAEKTIPDLIVSDVMMPELSGFDLLRKIRNEEVLSHIPVILLTARSDEESEAQALLSMADDYIAKPYSTNQLILKIDSLIAIRKLLKVKYKVELHEPLLSESTGKLEIVMENCPAEQKKFIKKVLDCMRDNISQPGFSVKDLSVHLHLSDSQIRRKVKAITGYSPVDTLRIIRLEAAARMIESGESLKAVAVDCGFSSQSHLGAVFKAYFGDTPNTYREKLTAQPRRKASSLRDT